MQGHLAIDVSASCVTSACGQISESNDLATRFAFLQRIADKVKSRAKRVIFSSATAFLGHGAWLSRD
jgi:hypothetical protein